MDYQDAKKIRGQSFGSRMADKLTEGQGFGASIKATLSEGSKARMAGIKEKFDPMNIGKFFGGKLGAAVVGKLTGRNQKDMEHFTGKKSSTKIGKLESGNEMVDMLMKIYSLMQKTNEDNAKMRDDQDKFKEEKEMERLRRHKELMEAITGEKYAGKASVIKKETTDASSPSSILDDILSAFGGAKSALSLLKLVGGFFLGPVGLAILGAASLGAFAYLIFKNKDSFEDPNSELSKGLRQAEEVGGLAGVKDEAERRKKMPEYDKTMAEIKDFETFQNEGEKLTNKQLEGFAKRGPGALEAVEDYKEAREKYKKIVGETTATDVPAGSEASSAPTAMASAAGSESSPAPTAMAQGTSSPNPGQQLNQVQGENLNAKVQEKLSEGESVVNNNAISKSLSSTSTKGPLPPVRNQEETFAKMIYESTRVV
jgi:hypothetical protein